MEIKYKNTLDDYVKFNWFLEKPIRFIVFYGFQALFLIYIISSFNFGDYSLSARMIVISWFIIIWILFRTFYHKVDKKLLVLRMKIKTKTDSSLLSEKTLIINENDIIVKSIKGVKKFNFDEILKIHKVDDCIHIVSKKHKCIAIIPTNILKDTEEELITKLKQDIK